MSFLRNNLVALPFLAVDVVAVFDQTFNQVFSQARAIKATVKESAKVMEHPVESGATITDHRIIEPVEIELSLIIQATDYADVYKSIKQYFLNSTLLVVQTKTSTYYNQIISAMPHDETPDMFNTVAIALSMKQVLFVEPVANVTPQSPVNSTKTDRGTQNGTTVTNTSVIADATDWFSKTASRVFGS